MLEKYALKDQTYKNYELIGNLVKANHTTLVNMLESNTQFQTPIYQRAYSWEKEHCKQLFDDIVSIGKNGEKEAHFIGAITTIAETAHPDEIPKYLIIDGQQRITSIMLLLKAINDSLNNPSHNATKSCTKDKVKQLMFNVNYDDDELYKLVLTEDESFKDVLNDQTVIEPNNISQNFKYFTRLISGIDNLDILWFGIKKLTLISILIDEKDDPQAIFESMNSTGLDLSQTDLIKNYILMSYKSSKQKEIYEKYWKSMEALLTSEDDNDFEEFLRHYLGMRFGRIIPKKQVYRYFKKHIVEDNRDKEEEIEIIYNYSEYYANLLGIKSHKSKELNTIIKYMRAQETSVAYPLLLKILADYANEIIDISETKSVFLLVESYIIRQYVCGIIKGSNKVFPEIIPKIDKKNYLSSIEKTIMSKPGNRIFPRDVYFKDSLKQNRLNANRTVCHYILTRLENVDTKSFNTDMHKIEYIMPEKLTDEWKNNLGENYEEINEKYCYTIGNLTLVDNDLNLNGKSFIEKRNEYQKSNIRITRKVAEHSKWSDESIQVRANLLAEQAIRIWPCPKYTGSLDDESEILENEYLEGKDIMELWNNIKKEIISRYDASFYMTKLYCGFKIKINNKEMILCTLKATKYKIDITYNTKITDRILQPSKILEDVSNIGKWGVGDLRQKIYSFDDIKLAIKKLDILYKNLRFVQNRSVKEIVKAKTKDPFKDPNTIVIPQKENGEFEFKEFYQYDEDIIKISRDNKSAIERRKRENQGRVFEQICGFGNSYKGGYVCIGIRDNGERVGLKKDMELGEFDDYTDQFARHIRETAEFFISDINFIMHKIEPNFIENNGEMICVIQVLPADHPIYYLEYDKNNPKQVISKRNKVACVRGRVPQLERLDNEQAIEYFKQRF